MMEIMKKISKRKAPKKGALAIHDNKLRGNIAETSVVTRGGKNP